MHGNVLHDGPMASWRRAYCGDYSTLGFPSLNRDGFPVSIRVFIVALLVGWLCLLSTRVDAEPAIIDLTDATRTLPLSPRQSYLLDPGGQLALRDVTLPAVADRFTAAGVDWPRLSLGNDTLWLRFDVITRRTQAGPWFLTFQYGDNADIKVYVDRDRDSASPAQIEPMDRRFHRLVAYRLDTRMDVPMRVYVRISAAASLAVPPMWLEPASHLAEWRLLEYLHYGATLGALLVLAGSAIIQFFVLRDASYGYVGLFIVAQAGQLVGLDGLARQFLPATPTVVLTLPTYVSIFAAVMAAGRILDAPSVAPVVHHILRALAAAALVMAVAVYWLPYVYLYACALALMALPAVAWLVLAAWRRRQPGALPFTLLVAAVAVGILPVVLAGLGLIPESHGALFLMHVASVLAALMLSFMLGDELLRSRIETASANAQLRAHQAELEHRVADRTRELSDALIRAKAADQAKSELLANVNHELRAPLGAVIGLGALLAETPLDARQRDYLAKAQGAANQLLKIVEEMLDFARMDRNVLQLRTEPFRVREVLSQIAAITEPAICSKGLALRMEVRPNVPDRIVGDRLMLERVLTNLVDNAIKFTERGWIELNVELAGRKTGEVSLRFTLRDTGIGIAAEHHAHLFEPFVQVGTNTAGKPVGVGLGLAISQGIVKRMGGCIDLDSVPGKGSAFFFVVSFKLPTEAGGLGADRPAAPGDAPALPAGLRVLVVEDDPLNQQVMRELLERMGVAVQVANDGQEALQALREGPLDLVFTDLRMPGINGCQLTQVVRESYAGDALPIVALTAHVGDDVRNRCLAAGMNDSLTKPVDPAQLAEVLRRWCLPRAGDAATAPVVTAAEPTVAARPTADAGAHDRQQRTLALLGPQGERRLLDAALAVLPEWRSRLLDALATDDVDEAREVTHLLKGSLNLLGTPRLAELLERVRETDREGRPALAEALDEELTRVLGTLAARRQ